MGNQVNILFQYRQISNQIHLLNRDGDLARQLTAFEEILRNMSLTQKGLLLKMYQLLKSKTWVEDKAHYQWEIDLQEQITVEDWGKPI